MFCFLSPNNCLLVTFYILSKLDIVKADLLVNRNIDASNTLENDIKLVPFLAQLADGLPLSFEHMFHLLERLRETALTTVLQQRGKELVLGEKRCHEADVVFSPFIRRLLEELN